MVRHEYSEEDIRAFIREGWNFRVKPSRGRRYITRRRGQDEKSLGPYSDELWGTIERLREQRAHLPEYVSEIMKVQERALKDLDEHLSLERSVHMMINCVHKDEGGNCIFWTWSSKPNFYEYAEELFVGKDIRLVGGRGSKKWVVRASTWFCKYCPAFRDKSI